MGDADEDDEHDEDSDDWILEKLFTPSGVCVAEDIYIEKEAITLDHPFDGWSPDDEESEGGYDDDERTLTEIYRRSCFVVVPDKQYTSFLKRASCINIQEWTKALLLQIDDNTRTASARVELLRICSITKGQCSVHFRLAKHSQFISISAVISGPPELSSRLDAVNFFDHEYHKAGALYENPERTPETIKQRDSAIQRCMNEALTKEPSNGILQTGKKGSSDLLKRARSQGESFVLEIAVPICGLVIKNMDFVVDILSQLFDEIKNAWISRSTVSTFARQVGTLLAEEMMNHCVSKSNDESKTDYLERDYFRPGRTEYSSYTMTEKAYGKTSMSWMAIAEFLTHCEMLEIYDCIPTLMRPLIEIANGSGTSEWTRRSDLKGFLMLLIRSLVFKLPAVSHDLSRYQTLFQQVLHHYIKDYVGQKPSPPNSLSRAGNESAYSANRLFNKGPVAWYDCKECRALNEFLAAPDRFEWRYKAAESSRKHLDRRLYRLDCTNYTDRLSGTPYTLVIQKTDKGHREAVKAWRQRSGEAKREVESYNQEKLKAFLGDQFESIMEQLSAITTGKTVLAGRQPLVPSTASTQNNKRASEGVENGPDAKRAKHVDIIDLR
ncbi:MAG: hypothetical protein Q9183_002913 [Haloplaca sp. 2 TL-2023]